jgi:Cu+-exporting ATPase
MKRVLTVALFGCVVACGGKAAESAPPATAAAAESHGEHHAHGTTPSGPMKAPGEANVGDTTKCPVSGEEFVVEASSPKAEYNGKTYYFCCSGCKKKFEASPEKFLGKS